MDNYTNGYYVRGTMLECYQRYRPKPTNISKLKDYFVDDTIRNDLPQEIINEAILSFHNRLWSSVAAAGGHSVDCLNTEKFELLTKSCVICFVIPEYILCATACSLKKWTLKFKLLYLLNHISCFHKICRICCIITHIWCLKVWLKCLLPSMK